MVRGLKKKLLIGLLSAAVVGTSLAPSVPLVGSFAQEVKADVGNEVVAADGVYVEEASAEAVVDKREWVAGGEVYKGEVYKRENDNYTKLAQPTSDNDTGVGVAFGSAESFNQDESYYKKDGDNYEKVVVTDASDFDTKKVSFGPLYKITPSISSSGNIKPASIRMISFP